MYSHKYTHTHTHTYIYIYINQTFQQLNMIDIGNERLRVGEREIKRDRKGSMEIH